MRLLIDYATGVYTGSILDDQSLVEALPGQGHCDQSVRWLWVWLDCCGLVPVDRFGWVDGSRDLADRLVCVSLRVRK